MLIEFPIGIIKADQKPAIENLRINVAQNRQMRIKFNVIKDDQDPVPLDIVVYEYRPSLEGIASFAIVAQGEEFNTHRPFKLTFAYELMKKRWRVRGSFNAKPIDETVNNIVELVNVVKTLV